MQDIKIHCAADNGDWLALNGHPDLAAVQSRYGDFATYIHLDAAGVAEAAGWLLGWLAEYAPEERTELLSRVADWKAILTGANDALAAAGFRSDEPVAEQIRTLAAERDRLRAERDSLEVKRKIERDRADAAEEHLNAIADAVGLGGTRTRWEGQLLARVAGMSAHLAEEKRENANLRAQLGDALLDKAEGGIAADRRIIADIRAILAGATVTWPEVTRG